MGTMNGQYRVEWVDSRPGMCVEWAVLCRAVGLSFKKFNMDDVLGGVGCAQGWYRCNGTGVCWMDRRG